MMLLLPVVMAEPDDTPKNVLLPPDVRAAAVPDPMNVLAVALVITLPALMPTPTLAIPFHATARAITLNPIAVLLSPVE